MCSIVEDDFGDDGGAHAMEEDPKTNGFEGETCCHCKIEKSVIKIGFKDPQCEACFLLYVRHKFRATLGCTKVVRRNSKVLLHFTGGTANSCLMDMIRYAFEQESHKRLCFDMDLVYIDENCVNNNDGQDAVKRFEKIQEVKSVLEQFSNFSCFYTTIASENYEELPLIGKVNVEDIAAVIESEKNFLEMFKALKSLSSKQDFLAVSRTDVLRFTASKLHCQSVFISDISLTLATRLLTNMSLGRGNSTACDVAFTDERIESLKFVRPIKDLSEAEVSSYVKFINLRCLDAVSYGDDHGTSASIQNLTLGFINGLQNNFSATVSTVYRTCGKIAPAERAPEVDGDLPQKFTRDLNITNKTQRCMMCKSFLDYHSSETLFAIEFSRIVAEMAGSENHLTNVTPLEERASDAVDGRTSEVRKHLCHGCRNIFIGIGDEELEEIF